MNRTKKFFKYLKFPKVTIANYYGRYIYLGDSNIKAVAENIDPGDIKFWPSPRLDVTEWVFNAKKG